MSPILKTVPVLVLMLSTPSISVAEQNLGSPIEASVISEIKANELLVQFRPNVLDSDASALLENLSLENIKKMSPRTDPSLAISRWWKVDVPDNIQSASVIDALSQHSLVELVERNGTYRTQ